MFYRQPHLNGFSIGHSLFLWPRQICWARCQGIHLELPFFSWQISRSECLRGILLDIYTMVVVVAQSPCPTLCDSMECSTPDLPVPYYLLEFAQVHIHCILIYLGLIWRPQDLFTFTSESVLAPHPCHTHHQAQVRLKNSGHDSQHCQKLNPQISGCQSPQSVQFRSVQSLSHVRLLGIPWIAACQASLSITNSRSCLKLTSIDSVIQPAISSSVVPFPSCPQSLPASGSFTMSQLFPWGGQSIGVSASASVQWTSRTGLL